MTTPILTLDSLILFLSRTQSEDISDLTELWAELKNVFMGDESLLSNWLFKPLPTLNGQAPISLMHTLYGRKALREVLDCICHGDFS